MIHRIVHSRSIRAARHSFDQNTVSRKKIILQFDARTTPGLRSIDRLLLCKGTSVKTGVKGVQESTDRYIYPLRVASDVDDGLEEPKRSANHVMARDADETWCAPTPENVCAIIFLRKPEVPSSTNKNAFRKQICSSERSKIWNRKNVMFFDGDITYCHMKIPATIILWHLC